MIPIEYFWATLWLTFGVIGSIRGVAKELGAGAVLALTLFALWFIRVPAAVLLSKQLGETGIWWSIPSGWTIGMILTFIYYKMGKWKSKVVVDPQPVKNP